MVFNGDDNGDGVGLALRSAFIALDDKILQQAVVSFAVMSDRCIHVRYFVVSNASLAVACKGGACITVASNSGACITARWYEQCWFLRVPLHACTALASLCKP